MALSPPEGPLVAPSRRWRVLIVDDDVLCAQGVSSLLEQEGAFEVVGLAHDGGAAVRAAVRVTPDVVLMDVKMPTMGGIDATTRIKERVPATRVVALSRHAEEGRVAGMLRAGASGYVLKCCPFETLVAAIHDVMQDRRYICREVADIVVGMMSGRASDHNDAILSLSHRERDVLRLLAEGFASREIGERLGISHRTVDHHRARIMGKLETHSIAGLTRAAVRAGIVAL